MEQYREKRILTSSNSDLFHPDRSGAKKEVDYH